ncbi:MAG: rhomboid family intramembrane serine protease [Oscillospiraceae bacterium]
MKHKFPQVEFNAPVIVWFTIISFVALLFSYATGGASTGMLFTCYRSGWLDPLMYIRMLTYVIGHADITHFVSNFTTIILIGPMLEEKYGSKRLLGMMAMTAFIGGLFNVVFTNHALVGASGIVFMFIILCSWTSVASGKIPLTMIFVVLIYIGQEVLMALTVQDNVSRITHILGGICGIGYGMYYNQHKLTKI